MGQHMGWRVLASGVAALLLLPASACSTTTGSGPLQTEVRDVRDFSTVELTTAGDVQIAQTGTESLTIEAQQNLLPELTSVVNGSTLVLGTKSGAHLVAPQPITYHLTVKNLVGLRTSASGNQVAEQITTPALAVEISGSGDITVGGTADRQEVTVSGSGDYHAPHLASKTVTAELSGSGDATVNVSTDLHASLSGSGDLIYAGDPTITSNKSGSGEVRRQ